jgi:hypothetical protein
MAQQGRRRAAVWREEKRSASRAGLTASMLNVNGGRWPLRLRRREHRAAAAAQATATKSGRRHGLRPFQVEEDLYLGGAVPGRLPTPSPEVVAALPSGGKVLRRRQGDLGGALRDRLRALARLRRRCGLRLHRLRGPGPGLPASTARRAETSTCSPSPARVVDPAHRVRPNAARSSAPSCAKRCSRTSRTAC